MLEKEEKYDFFEITNSKHPALYAPESPVCVCTYILDILRYAAQNILLHLYFTTM